MTPAYPASQTSPNRENNSLQSTINLHSSLVDFYQEERVWVNRVRTDLARASSRDGATDDQKPLLTGSSSSSSSDQQGSSSSRWSYRKNEFGLRLDGLSSKMKECGLQQKEHILELFDKMIETRMESCQRVNELLRQAAVSAFQSLTENLFIYFQTRILASVYTNLKIYDKQRRDCYDSH